MDLWTDFTRKFQAAFVTGDRWKLYLGGLLSTLELTVFALALGTVLGVIVAVLRSAHDQQRLGQHNPILAVLNAVCKVYTTVIRGTPMLVQLLIWRFVILPTVRDYTLVGALGLGINSGAYVAEIVRGGLMSVDAGQSEAGRSLGLGYLDTMRFIIIPQAFKNVLPALANEFIALLKETAVSGYIGLMDLTKGGDVIRGRTFSAFMPLIAVALIYLALVMFFTWLIGKLERRLRSSER